MKNQNPPVKKVLGFNNHGPHLPAIKNAPPPDICYGYGIRNGFYSQNLQICWVETSLCCSAHTADFLEKWRKIQSFALTNPFLVQSRCFSSFLNNEMDMMSFSSFKKKRIACSCPIFSDWFTHANLQPFSHLEATKVDLLRHGFTINLEACLEIAWIVERDVSKKLTCPTFGKENQLQRCVFPTQRHCHLFLFTVFGTIQGFMYATRPTAIKRSKECQKHLNLSWNRLRKTCIFRTSGFVRKIKSASKVNRRICKGIQKNEPIYTISIFYPYNIYIYIYRKLYWYVLHT